MIYSAEIGKLSFMLLRWLSLATRFLFAGVLLAGCTSTSQPTAAKRPTPEMTAPPDGADASSYRKRVFYELWVRSFQDSDGDGIGDMKGLLSRMDELQDMGIGGIWLMPTFPSPLADSGYDVADYQNVHPDYGSLEDLDAVVKAAHARGMLVYLDMVFNHTSDDHAWFKSALTGPTSPYFNYFVWNAEPATRCSDVPAASFGKTRWTYVEAADLYYFHQFYPRQPDLNFTNPAVQDELLGVLKFWMKRDIDGFRFDVPDRYFEEGDLCAHRAKTVDFHARLRDTISGEGKLSRGFVGEIWGIGDEVMKFFGPRGNPMIFNFQLLFSFYTSIAVGSSPGAMAAKVDVMLKDLPAESRWGIIVGNHDTPRFAEVAAGDPARLRLAAALQLTLPGVPYLWMGEELGLRMGKQVNVDWRDGARTPYPWNAEPGFGFTTSDKPFLAYSPFSGEQSFAVQRPDPDSLLNYYRRLISIRNGHEALQDGTYASVYRDDSLWVFARSTANETLSVAHNFARTGRVEWKHASATGVTDLVTGEAFAPGVVIPIAAGNTRILQPLTP